MDPAYAAHYAELQEKHWWWRARERFVVDALDRSSPPEGWKRALDIGCGPGLFLEVLKDFAREVEGLEPDPSLAAVAEARHRVHVQPFDQTFRPVVTYDLITMLDVLEHLPEPVAALRHVGKLLDDAGSLVLTVPAHPLLWTSHDELNHHYRRYTRRALALELEEAGLRVTDARHFFHWVVAPKVAQRALEAVREREPTPPRLPPVWLNRTLELLSRTEQVVSRHLPIPIGTSILSVARRG